jgi:hypothetical protein
MGSSSRRLLNQATHLQRGELDSLLGLPGCSAMDQLGLVESVDLLGQRVVVAVALAPHRGLDASLGQPLAVADADVLRPAIRVMDQAAVAFGLPCVQRLLAALTLPDRQTWFHLEVGTSDEPPLQG